MHPTISSFFFLIGKTKLLRKDLLGLLLSLSLMGTSSAWIGLARVSFLEGPLRYLTHVLAFQASLAV